MAPKPALAKTASMRPKRSSAAAAIASTWSHSVTSQRTASARSSPPSSAASSSSASIAARRQHQPVARAAAARAVAAPMPLLAPVISRTGSLGHAAILASGRARGRACDNPRSVDPQRKRKIRLVVALSVAVLLAVALVYTSFSASTEAKEPSQLLSAAPGTSYELTGKVVKGSVQPRRRRPRFRVADRDGGGESLPVTYSGTVPDPFRGGREIVLTGEVEQRHLRRRARHPGHQVPVEVHDRE